MKVVAITRFKQGDMYRAIKQAGWSQAELARQAGITSYLIGEYINMKRRPSESHADLIYVALKKIGIRLNIHEVWPETFKGINSSLICDEIRDVNPSELISDTNQSPQHLIDMDIAREDIDGVLDSLDERQREVILDMYFSNMTRKECGEKHGVSACRIYQIEAHALRKLRHPTRVNALNSAAETVLNVAWKHVADFSQETEFDDIESRNLEQDNSRPMKSGEIACISASNIILI